MNEIFDNKVSEIINNWDLDYLGLSDKESFLLVSHVFEWSVRLYATDTNLAKQILADIERENI